MELTGSAFPGTVYTGTIGQIANSARRQYSGTTQETVVDVTVNLDAPDEGIKAGYSVKAKVVTSEERTVKVLSYEAVAQDADGTEYVYVFRDGVARRCDIRTGEEFGEGVEVLSGLTGSDIILASPAAVKADGKYVRLKR